MKKLKSIILAFILGYLCRRSGTPYFVYRFRRLLDKVFDELFQKMFPTPVLHHDYSRYFHGNDEEECYDDRIFEKLIKKTFTAPVRHDEEECCDDSPI